MLVPTLYFYQYWKESGLTLVLNIEPKHNLLVEQFIHQFVSYLHYQINQYHLQNKQSYQSHLLAFNNFFQQEDNINPQTKNIVTSKLFNLNENDLTTNKLLQRNLLEKSFLKGQSLRDVKQEQFSAQNLSFEQQKVERLTKNINKFNCLYWGKSFSNFTISYLVANSPYIQFLVSNNSNYQTTIDHVLDQVFHKKLITTSFSLDLHSKYEQDFVTQKLEQYYNQLNLSHDVNKVSDSLNKQNTLVATDFNQFPSFSQYKALADVSLFINYTLNSWLQQAKLNDQLNFDHKFINEVNNLITQDKSVQSSNQANTDTSISSIINTYLDLGKQDYQELTPYISPFLRLNSSKAYQTWLNQIKLKDIDNSIPSLWLETIENTNLYTSLIDQNLDIKDIPKYQKQKVWIEFNYLASTYQKLANNLTAIVSQDLTEITKQYYQFQINYWLNLVSSLAINGDISTNLELETFSNYNKNKESNGTANSEFVQQDQSVLANQNSNTQELINNFTSKKENSKQQILKPIALSLADDFRPQQQIYNRNRRISVQSDTQSVYGFVAKQLDSNNTNSLLANKSSKTAKTSLSNNNPNANEELLTTLLGDLANSQQKSQHNIQHNTQQNNFNSNTNLEYPASYNSQQLNQYQRTLSLEKFGEWVRQQVQALAIKHNQKLEFINSFVKIIENLDFSNLLIESQSLEQDDVDYEFKFYDNSELVVFDKNRVKQISVANFNLDYAIYNDVNLSLLSLQNYLNKIATDNSQASNKIAFPQLLYISSGLTFLYQSLNKDLLQQSLYQYLVTSLVKIFNQHELSITKLELLLINFNEKAKILVLEIIKVLNELEYLQQTYNFHIILNLNLFQLAKTLQVTGKDLWKYINISKFNLLSVSLDHKSDTSQLDNYLVEQPVLYQLACVNNFEQNYVQALKQAEQGCSLLTNSCLMNINCNFLDQAHTSSDKQVLQSKYYFFTKQLVLNWK